MKKTLITLLGLFCLFAAQVSAQTNTPPIPQNLVAEVVFGGINSTPFVRLTWDATSMTLGFKVYRSVEDTLHFVLRGATYNRVFNDNEVEPNHTYHYRVTSFIQVNGTTIESPPSALASATIPPPPGLVQGILAGLVTDDSTNAPIANVRIVFFRVVGNPTTVARYTFTDSLGHYAALLDTGRYIVKAEPPYPYRLEYFDNSPDPAGATVVTVSQNALSFANFGLGRYITPTPGPRGTIAGTVIDDSTALPIAHVRIRFFRSNIVGINTMPVVYTDVAGHYQALLDTGRYLVKAEPPSPYRPEWFDNSPDPAGATPVFVVVNQTSIANFGLSRPAPPTYVHISGRVTDTLGNPLAGASVAIMRTIQEMNALAALTGNTPGTGPEAMNLEPVGYTLGVIWRGYTDSLGNYSAQVIADRNYIAMASKFGYLPEYFDNKPNPMLADIIHVTGDTSGIDFSLSVNPAFQNSIRGMVRDSFGVGVPSRVVLLPLRNTPGITTAARFGHTDSLGNYFIDHVFTGRYFVRAIPFSGYAPAFYKEGAYGVEHWEDADTVLISGNVTGINIGVVQINSIGATRLSGMIRTSAAAPLAGVLVVARSGEQVVGCALTNTEGAYTMEALPAGLISISADRDGYLGAGTTASISTGTFTVNGVNITMSPTVATSVLPASTTPETFALDPNYPNPFNPTTTISYSLPVSSAVTLKVYNLLGQEIATLVNGQHPAGVQEVVWDGKDNAGRVVPSGIYFYRISALPTAGGREFTQVRKMVLMK
jgi:hypothetical protein